MPYDPSGALPQGETLAVHVVGAVHEPDCTYELGRPQGGLVHGRAFPAGGSPAPFEAPAAELLARFERAQREGRRVSVELYALRRWLTP